MLAPDPWLAAARQWFRSVGREPFEFQEAVWQAYWRGESGLLNAGTGSGKTLAAWLGPVMESLSPAPATSAAGVRVLWITPLRALARDLVLGLQAPLSALGCSWRVELRTGDTSSSVRARQKRRPPEALITTPESLSLLLSDAGFLPALGGVRAVVVDEWHEFLGNKRGVQLELVLARLRALSPQLRVWGLSATLPDLGDAMRVLLGPSRTGTLIRAPHAKRYDIDALLPDSVLRFPWSGHLGLAMLPAVLQRVAAARTTLIFTNTRSQAELWYQSIVTAQADWLTTTAIHHGSIDPKVRRRVEDALREGRLRCVVCTSSLDLGIDFPPVDQVLQIGSPKGVARLLQRAGRSGHRPGETSHIGIVPTHAWELVECAAARAAAQALRLEPRHGLRLSLDVLAQHLVTLAVGGGFTAEELLAEVRGTHAFAELRPEQWQWTLDFITRGGTALQGYPQYRRVHLLDDRYQIAGADLARRHRRAIGTITSDASVQVKWLRGGTLGVVEESFLGKLRPRDVFIFAGRVLELARVRDSVAYVRIARKRSNFVPRWQGSRLPLAASLGEAMLELLDRWEHDAAADPELQAIAPLLALQRRWSAMPTRTRLLVEQYRNREGYRLCVFPFAGRMLNEGIATLMSARAAREEARTFSITTNEYGFELLCAEPFAVDEQRLRQWAHVDGLADEMLAALNLSELARRQFRDIARIAGLVDPGMPGRGKSARQLQASSGLMFEVLERHDPANLLLEQSRREVLESQLAYRELQQVLERMASQRWELHAPPQLTPLSFPLWSDRLQTQTVSTESWQARIEREARRIERAAT